MQGNKHKREGQSKKRVKKIRTRGSESSNNNLQVEDELNSKINYFY